MPGWTLVNTHPVQGRTFERPLSPAEVGFVLDARINGTTDSGQYIRLRLLRSSQDAHLFSKANITRAWVSTKRRFPLVGATIFCPKMEGGIDDLDLKTALQARFIVRERDLVVIRPNEVIFGEVADARKMQDEVVTIFAGPRALSEDLPAQLRIYHETSPYKTDVLHVVMLIAHSVSDLTAITTLTRCFFDTLARGGDPDSEPAQHPLEERLAMMVPPAELLPKHLRSFNVARRRWRMAIGHVIYQLMMKKNLGGHTLPCRVTTSTSMTPSRTSYVSVSISDAETATVLANCRLHKLTFGNAYLPLAQVAMTRVLYRRYLRGEISEEEWEYRKRQPYLNVGPLSLRPRLDEEWFERGGGGEFVLSMSIFFYKLPFMTLGTTEGRKQSRRWSGGAPPFSDLLTFDRFLYRAGLAKKQAAALFGHPLFFEIVHVAGLAHARRAWLNALQWMGHKDATSNEDKALAVTDFPVAVAHGGSSIGNVDVISPTEFPLPPIHPLSPYASVSHPRRAGYVDTSSQLIPNTEVMVPKIVVESGPTMLFTHPGELYLGTSSLHGQIKMYAYYDKNVFEDGVVKEWLDEVRAAVLLYLGQTREHNGRDILAKL